MALLAITGNLTDTLDAVVQKLQPKIKTLILAELEKEPNILDTLVKAYLRDLFREKSV